MTDHLHNVLVSATGHSARFMRGTSILNGDAEFYSHQGKSA
ncbi:hypothetical protein [Agrobacterium sp.]|jgi:hypothetical protein|nr:hypothetical protein [Agrobacterium sp.]